MSRGRKSFPWAVGALVLAALSSGSTPTLSAFWSTPPSSRAGVGPVPTGAHGPSASAVPLPSPPASLYADPTTGVAVTVPSSTPAADSTTRVPAEVVPPAPTVRKKSAVTTTAPVLRARPEQNRAAPAPSVPVQAQGALWPGDFPDPSVLRVGAFYYAYSTEVGLDAVPTIRSVDLVHWQFVGDALASLPEWSDGVDVWAPAVIADGIDYVLFYATRDARTGDQCISRAVSTSPSGPFIDTSVDPFVCQLDQGGDIDPQPFVDANGTDWLIWKSQGTEEGQPPRLWSARVTDRWTVLAPDPTPILGLSQRWEGSVVEAPTMVRQANQYFLLYSGNDWASGSYAVGYALCRSVLGPCAKPDKAPVLASHGDEAGPGSPGFFYDTSGRLRVVFHAWSPGHVGYPGGARSLRMGTVSVTGTKLSIQG